MKKKAGTLVTCLFLVALLVACDGGFGGRGSDSGQVDQITLETGQSEIAAFSKTIGAAVDIRSFETIFKEMQRTEGELIRESVDLSATTVKYFSLEDAQIDTFRIAEDDRPLKVEDHSPTGELPIENRRPTIYVAFSQPIVPISKLGQPLRESHNMRIEPPVEGTYRWYGTRTLSFEPDQPLLKQREYTVTVSGETRSLGGKTLAEDFSFQFTTEYLDIVDFRCGDYDDYSPDLSNVPPQHDETILVAFNQAVNLELIKGFFRVTADGRDLPFEVRRPESSTEQGLIENHGERMVVLDLSEKPPRNRKVVVTLAEGARSEEDYAPRPSQIERSYHTLLPFRYLRHSTWSYSFPRNPRGTINPVYLTFNQPVDEESAARWTSTSLTGNEVLGDRLAVWKNGIRINNLPVQHDSSYQLYLDAGLSDVYGQHLEQLQSISVKVGAAPTYTRFPAGSRRSFSQRILEAQFAPPRIIYEFQNILSGRWRIGPRSDPFTANSTIPWQIIDFAQYPRNIAHYEVVDLTSWLPETGRGAVEVEWDFDNPRNPERSYQAKAVIQVTDLGVTVRYAYNRVLVWVNSLSTGQPVAGASVSLRDRRGGIRRSDADHDGLAVFGLAAGEYRTLYYSDGDPRGPDYRVIVETGNDRVEFAPKNRQPVYSFGVNATDWPGRVEEAVKRTFMFTDRGLYKPGETVTFRGVDWNQTLAKFSPYRGPYTIEVKRSRRSDTVFLKDAGETTSSGGFHGTFTVPEDLEPDTYHIVYTRGGRQVHSIRFEVAFFRRLNFQVSTHLPSRPFYQGDRISIPIRASYLAGGVMPNAPFSYFFSRRPESYTPSGQRWRGWVFGPYQYESQRSLSAGDAKLNALGEGTAEQETSEAGVVGKAYRYSLEVTVEDIDRQQVSTRASAVVHPASFYIGAKLTSSAAGWWSRFVEAKKATTAEVTLVRPDGTIYEREAPLEISLIKQSWKAVQQQGVYGRVATRYTQVEEVVATDTIPYRGEQTTYRFTPAEGGRYLLRLTAVDGSDRTAVTDLRFYASGSAWVRWANTGDIDINLVLDQELYSVGDTARIMVQTPLERGKYLVTIEREGIFDEEIVEIVGSTHLLEIPVTEEHVPVIYVAVTSISERMETPASYFEPDLGKPKTYFGLVGIPVSTRTRELEVELIPNRNVYRPGQEAEVLIKVTREGEPVAGAELTFLAVDRGVLDLINYHVPNPLPFFYSKYHFPHAVHGFDTRSLLMNPVTYDVSSLQGGDGEKLERREDFVPLAIFEPFLFTDEKGYAKVEFVFPDTLTTYRATAIAFEGSRIGYAEDEFLVQNPINVRTALPRRMRYRDTAVAGVILQNLDDVEHEVTVRLAAEGIQVVNESEKVVTVPPASVYEVSFLLTAEQEGTAELVFTLLSDVLREELVDIIEIEKPLVREAFTTIGSVGLTSEDGQDLQSAAEGLILPARIASNYGSVTLQLDSTQIPFLRKPLEDLYSHIPYSWIIGQGYNALPGILFPGEADLLLQGPKTQVRSRVSSYFSIAGRYQLEDGGIKSGARSRTSSPTASLQVALYTLLAQTNGVSTGTSLDTNRLFSYLEGLKSQEKTPFYTKAHVLYVQALRGDDVTAELGQLARERDALGISGNSFVALGYLARGERRKAEAIYRRLKNSVVIGTRSIDILETYEARHYFDSAIQQLALMMQVAVLLDEPPEAISRYTNTLNQKVQGARWASLYDVSWAALGMYRIVAGEERKETDFTAKVRLDEQEIVNRRFQGLSFEPAIETFSINASPLAEFERDRLYPLLFQKEGVGILHYATTIEYALPSEVVLPRDEGISVLTQIEDLEGTVIDGESLALGETYRCRVFISTSKRRSYLNLAVPVPSGAEILDSTFVTTGRHQTTGGVTSESVTRETIYGDEIAIASEGYLGYDQEDWWVWHYRPNMLIYDNFIAYEWLDFYRGSREVSFLFRTTTPGIYPTPPASAELMFEPEVFGRSKGSLFVIQ